MLGLVSAPAPVATDLPTPIPNWKVAVQKSLYAFKQKITMRAGASAGWETAPYRDMHSTTYFGDFYLYVPCSPFVPFPPNAKALAEQLIAVGEEPHIEWFYDDPFLYVVRDGKRVYLLHW